MTTYVLQIRNYVDIKVNNSMHEAIPPQVLTMVAQASCGITSRWDIFRFSLIGFHGPVSCLQFFLMHKELAKLCYHN